MIISDKFGNGGHVMKIPTTMDDSSVSHQNGGQLGPQIGGTISDKQTEEPSQTPEYSIPGILHFIQHEWARFELERSQWEVDRAEFEARIAFLQGERKGLENLRNDLVRRIKMLEYALKQERGKFHKLKYGVELQQGDTRPPADEESELAEQGPEPLPNVTWRQGRQLIRQYFEEIGYAETILDVRSNRVRALLGLNNNTDQDDNISLNLNGNESDKRGSDTQGHSSHDNENRDVTDAGCVTVRRAPGTVKKALVGGSRGPASEQSAMLDGEAAVLANFEFLTGQEMDVDDLDDMDTKPSSTIITNPDEVDAEAEEVLNELDILSRDDDDIVKQENKGMIWTEVGRSGTCVRDGDEDSLALGELAQLSVTNEADAYNLVQAKVSFRKTWNAKYTLRSHFDGVRALAFHPTESVLITASEDHTLKLWNLHKTVPAKKSANLDVEPLYTFRAHRGAVLCLAMGTAGQQCWSGGLDGAVRTWNVPPSTTDPYDAYEPDVVGPALLGHTDAVWSLAHCRQRLLSASADGTVRLWSPGTAQPLTSTLRSEADGAPTCVDFAADGTRAVASFQSAHTVIFDLETGKPVTRLEGEGRGAMRVVSHPSSPLTVTAHEDRHIRFWDNETGQLTHSMVAHLDAVTSLAVDPNGLFLLSGSHDCSIRLWNLDNKTCVQEITAHRKKFDESILDVAFHPARPYIASAGADALAKVFV